MNGGGWAESCILINAIASSLNRLGMHREGPAGREKGRMIKRDTANEKENREKGGFWKLP